ncbi:unnamed protein product [Owenia fusiformis]|uniref:Death domain-containing protein n=1 Tax=Owenia fusiformis TaxID=6347 RepID=A0A8S4PZP3_OWEFU|nr:unnamed protein product [Owenia fusiformis]
MTLLMLVFCLLTTKAHCNPPQNGVVYTPTKEAYGEGEIVQVTCSNSTSEKINVTCKPSGHGSDWFPKLPTCGFQVEMLVAIIVPSILVIGGVIIAVYAWRKKRKSTTERSKKNTETHEMKDMAVVNETSRKPLLSDLQQTPATTDEEDNNKRKGVKSKPPKDDGKQIPTEQGAYKHLNDHERKGATSKLPKVARQQKRPGQNEMKDSADQIDDSLDDILLLSIGKRITNSLVDMAVQLKLGNEVVDNIMASNQRVSSYWGYQLLTTWHQSTEVPNKRRVLATALRGIGRTDLAQEVEKYKSLKIELNRSGSL